MMHGAYSVKLIVWSLEAINYLFTAFIIQREAKCHRLVDINSYFFPIKLHGSPEIYPWAPWGVRITQMKNGQFVLCGPL